MSYEIRETLEYLYDCISEDWEYDDFGGGKGRFIPTLTYEGKEVVRLLRLMNKIYDERGYGEY